MSRENAEICSCCNRSGRAMIFLEQKVLIALRPRDNKIDQRSKGSWLNAKKLSNRILFAAQKTFLDYPNFHPN